MNDQQVHQARSNWPVDRLAVVGSAIAILLSAAAVVVYLI